MEASPTNIPDVLLLEPKVYEDERGFFLEAYNLRNFEKLGISGRFVQDNHSGSSQGVLRGLHYQAGEHAQGKLVRVLAGRVFDVAVDIRRSSATFGRWTGVYLDDESHAQMWIPPGFAHGFLVVSDSADVAYKTTTFYHAASERCIRYDDAAIGIDWPLADEPVLSPRDAAAGALAQAELFP